MFFIIVYVVVYLFTVKGIPVFYLSVTMYIVICGSVGHNLLYSLIKVMVVQHDMIRNGLRSKS